MALPKRLGKRRNYEVRGRDHSVPFRKPPSHFPSIGAFDEGFELREEDDFLLVEAEESMIRKMLFEIQSLKDDKEALQRQVNDHLHREVEMQCRIAHLEKQNSMNQYWYNDMQVRMQELEAQLDSMRLERSRLVAENSTLKTQVKSQHEIFELAVKRQDYRISLLEVDSKVMTEQIQQLEAVNKVCDVMQGLDITHSERVALPPDVTLPDDAIIPTVSTETLVEFIPEMAQKWEFIGHKLGLANKVMALRTSEKPAETKCLAMLAEWVQSGREVTWQQLLKVLTNSGILLYNVASKIKQHLLDNAS